MSRLSELFLPWKYFALVLAKQMDWSGRSQKPKRKKETGWWGRYMCHVLVQNQNQRNQKAYERPQTIISHLLLPSFSPPLFYLYPTEKNPQTQTPSFHFQLLLPFHLPMAMAKLAALLLLALIAFSMLQTTVRPSVSLVFCYSVEWVPLFLSSENWLCFCVCGSIRFCRSWLAMQVVVETG